MKKNKFVLLIILLGILSYCRSQDQSNLKTSQIVENMNSYISIFEIPALDIPRAIKFYQEILDLEIEELEFPGMHMGLFPYENQKTVGVIIKSDDNSPSANGITVYLNAGNDLQIILDKIIVNGGTIKVPKTAHVDESGYFAIFMDTEGNRLGLHSIN